RSRPPAVARATPRGSGCPDVCQAGDRDGSPARISVQPRGGSRGLAREPAGLDRAVDLMMNLHLLEGWVPLRLIWRNGQPSLDWGFVGTRRFTDSFFEQTIGRCLQHP